MNGKVDPFMNMGVPKELLTGEKMLAKGADIGNQLAQDGGITISTTESTIIAKIVCGMKHYGRHLTICISSIGTEEVLLGFGGVKTIATGTD